MTPTTETPARAAPTARAGKGRSVWVIAIGAGLAVLLLVGALLLGRGASTTGESQVYLDPGNTGGTGTAALAAVLEDSGVDVLVARDRADLAALGDIGPETALIAAPANRFTDATAADLIDRAADAARLFLVDPDDATLADFELDLTTGAPAFESEVPAACAIPGIDPADRITPGAAAFYPDGIGIRSPETSCFPDDYASWYDERYELVTFPAGVGLPIHGNPPFNRYPPITVMTGEFLTNATITEADNAGVALRLLGAADRLIWYVPDPSDTDAVPPAAGLPDVPRALWPLILLAFFAVLIAMIWRGIRFGPLADEPLPVTVPAAETTRARARLYHRAQDAPRAAGLLREHTLRRLGRRLSLPWHPTDPGSAVAIAEAAARAIGTDPVPILELLTGPLPSDDAALVDYVSRLTALDQEVHRTP